MCGTGGWTSWPRIGSARALSSPACNSQAQPANPARSLFLDAARRNSMSSGTARSPTLALLRAEAGRNPRDRALSGLIRELASRSEIFRTWWTVHRVRFHRDGTGRSTSRSSAGTCSARAASAARERRRPHACEIGSWTLVEWLPLTPSMRTRSLPSPDVAHDCYIPGNQQKPNAEHGSARPCVGRWWLPTGLPECNSNRLGAVDGYPVQLSVEGRRLEHGQEVPPPGS